MKDIIKPVIVLVSICLIVTAVLASVNQLTRPVIAAAEEKAAEQARSEVLDGAKSFEKLSVPKLPDGTEEIYKGSDNSGYVVITKAKGYGGDIKIICGIKPDGSIAEVKTLSHSETNGVGTKAVSNDSDYRTKFVGKTARDYKKVDTVSGATISSAAYKKAIGIALDAYSAAKEAGF